MYQFTIGEPQFTGLFLYLMLQQYDKHHQDQQAGQYRCQYLPEPGRQPILRLVAEVFFGAAVIYRAAIRHKLLQALIKGLGQDTVLRAGSKGIADAGIGNVDGCLDYRPVIGVQDTVVARQQHQVGPALYHAIQGGLIGAGFYNGGRNR